jgi:predicted DCC family thiol-disulfide oxidoreductase YuxK
MSAAATPGRPDGRPVLLYDTDCGFCRWAVAKVLAWDAAGRLRLVALQDAEADALLAGMPQADRMASWHLATPDGVVRSGGPVAPALLRMRPRGRVPAAALERAAPVVDRGYRWVAGHRTLVSKLVPAAAKRRADAQIARRRAADA